MFEVGQEVVCIRADDTHDDGRQELVLNQIYNVRWIGMTEPNLKYDSYLGVRLVGVTRSLDIPFSVERFRPLKKRQTDISAFISILNSVKQTEDA